MALPNAVEAFRAREAAEAAPANLDKLTKNVYTDIGALCDEIEEMRLAMAQLIQMIHTLDTNVKINVNAIRELQRHNQLVVPQVFGGRR